MTEYGLPNIRPNDKTLEKWKREWKAKRKREALALLRKKWEERWDYEESDDWQSLWGFEALTREEEEEREARREAEQREQAEREIAEHKAKADATIQDTKALLLTEPGDAVQTAWNEWGEAKTRRLQLEYKTGKRAQAEREIEAAAETAWVNARAAQREADDAEALANWERIGQEMREHDAEQEQRREENKRLIDEMEQDDDNR